MSPTFVWFKKAQLTWWKSLTGRPPALKAPIRPSSIYPLVPNEASLIEPVPTPHFARIPSSFSTMAASIALNKFAQMHWRQVAGTVGWNVATHIVRTVFPQLFEPVSYLPLHYSVSDMAGWFEEKGCSAIAENGKDAKMHLWRPKISRSWFALFRAGSSCGNSLAFHVFGLFVRRKKQVTFKSW